MIGKLQKGLTLAVLGSAMALQAAAFSVKDLKTDYQKEPLALDNLKPAFSWKMYSDKGERNLKQDFYQIVVSDVNGNQVWNSGKVSGDDSVDIRYCGNPLKPEAEYSWNVTVWNTEGKTGSCSSTFKTGLNPERRGTGNWEGAKWIGSNDEVLPLIANRTQVFKINYEMTIKPGSTKASIVYGANDERLMSSSKNLFGIKNEINESYIKVELDVSEVVSGKNAKINIYRAGYTAEDDASKVFVSINIPSNLIGKNNVNQKHSFTLESNQGIVTFVVDGTALESPMIGYDYKGYNLNPMGDGGDYIVFPYLCDIGFAAEKGQSAVVSNLSVNNYRTPFNAIFKEDETSLGIFSKAGVKGFEVRGKDYIINASSNDIFVTANPSHSSMPMLRKDFSVEKTPVKSTLYVTSRGAYDFYVNGTRVNESYLNPGLTQYNATHKYDVYDVSKLVKNKGANAMGAQLFEGWWSGAITYTGANWNFFGDRSSLLAKLVIEYSDGTKETVVTDESWQCYTEGPLVGGSLFQGELYNALKEKEISGWTKKGFNSSAWKKASVIEVNPSNSYIGVLYDFITGQITMMNYDNLTIVSNEDHGVEAVKTITAKSVTKISDDVYIYDMGENMTGVPNIVLPGTKPGTEIKLRFAEVLYPENDSHEGHLMLENIRGAYCQDKYITKGSKDVISPRSTYHGYRYVEVTGLTKPLSLKNVQGFVLTSAVTKTAEYKTSDETVNKLFENIWRSTQANFFSIPTDCPQRNERMGWSGDLSVFVRSGVYLTDADRFMSKQLNALRDMQQMDGRFTAVAPVGGGFGGILWSSAGMTVPWHTYLQYGDKSVLENHYASMKKYAAFLETIITDDGHINERQVMPGLGDWLSPEYEKSDAEILWYSYLLYDMRIMKNVAELLGFSEDVSKYDSWYKEHLAWFNAHFINDQGKTVKIDGGVNDTQASYAVILGLDLVEEKNLSKVVSQFNNTLTRENVDDLGVTRPQYSLMTGFIGTSWISEALSKNGLSDSAYKLLENRQYPSWLYPVNQGATTIWERLNSYTKENGFGGNNSMNSFNHYSFGAVSAWMIDSSLGIKNNGSAGFKSFTLAPEVDFGKGITFAKGHYDSVYGRIESSWKITDNSVIYEFTVPANTEAQFVPSNSEGYEVLENTVYGSGTYTVVQKKLN